MVGLTNGHSNGAASTSNGLTTFHNPRGRVGFDMSGITPAPVTPFNEDGSVDYEAIQRIGSWLATVEGVKGLVVLGHAGEGTFLTEDEQVSRVHGHMEKIAC